MDLGLQGRVALFTGASGGIDDAIARALAAEGTWLQPPTEVRQAPLSA